MANWFEKLTKVAEQVVTAVEDVTNKTVKTYQEQGFNGIVEKTGTLLDKTGEKLEKVGTAAAERTQDYLKNLGEANKEVISEVENNVGKGTITGKIAGGLAATAYTTQAVALDLASATKNVYQKLATSVNTTSTNTTQLSIEDIPLDVIFETVMNAQKTDNKWKDSQGRTYIVFEDSWYCTQTKAGGKNAVSLTAYHLASIAQMDYNDPEQNKALTKEAINVLSTSGLTHSAQNSATERNQSSGEAENNELAQNNNEAVKQEVKAKRAKKVSNEVSTANTTAKDTSPKTVKSKTSVRSETAKAKKPASKSVKNKEQQAETQQEVKPSEESTTSNVTNPTTSTDSPSKEKKVAVKRSASKKPANQEAAKTVSKKATAKTKETKESVNDEQVENKPAPKRTRVKP